MKNILLLLVFSFISSFAIYAMQLDLLDSKDSLPLVKKKGDEWSDEERQMFYDYVIEIEFDNPDTDKLETEFVSERDVVLIKNWVDVLTQEQKKLIRMLAVTGALVRMPDLNCDRDFEEEAKRYMNSIDNDKKFDRRKGHYHWVVDKDGESQGLILFDRTGKRETFEWNYKPHGNNGVLEIFYAHDLGDYAVEEIAGMLIRNEIQAKQDLLEEEFPLLSDTSNKIELLD